MNYSKLIKVAPDWAAYGEELHRLELNLKQMVK